MPMAVGLIVVSGLAAYANSFSGPFIYDDVLSIPANPTIRRLSAIGEVLSPPSNGETVSGRPLLNLSFAIDYAIGGTNTRGYHVTNLAIHILNGLLLLGILHRTFCLPVLRSRFGDAALGLALAISLVWVLHPLQTESVTYIAQRAESLAALSYLVVLYAVIRGIQSAQPSYWYVLAVGACLSGMGIKETVVTVPLVVLLYDHTLVSGTFRESFQRRWGLYLGLIASWAVLIGLVWSTGLWNRQGELGSPDPWFYARSQPEVILHYLRLSLWPHPLCFSYGWPVAHSLREILPGTVMVGLLGTLTVWGLWKRRGWGFLGAWFFLILAPTSSIMPLRQLAFEHRMYLSLAAVLTAVAVAVYIGGQRLVRHRRLSVRGSEVAAVCLVTLTAIAQGILTHYRNETYRTALSIWEATVTRAPQSHDAHNHLGIALAELGRLPEAIEHYQEAVRLKPDYASAHNNLGLALAGVGRLPEAIEHYRKAVRSNPDEASAHANLAMVLAGQQNFPEAIEHYRELLRLEPDFFDAYCNLGVALARIGRIPEAIECYEHALRINPLCVPAHYNLCLALCRSGKIDQAIEQGLKAIPLASNHSRLNRLVAWLMATHEAADRGVPKRAVEFAERANTLTDHRDIKCLDTLAAAYASAGRFDDAVSTAKQAWQLAQVAGQASQAEEIHSRLQLYRERKPYREPAVTPSPQHP